MRELGEQTSDLDEKGDEEEDDDDDDDDAEEEGDGAKAENG